MPKFILTGSTGVLGSKVLEHLLKLGLDSQDIILSVYNTKGVDSQLAKLVFDVRHMVIIITKKLLKKHFKVEKFYFLFHQRQSPLINELQSIEMLLMPQKLLALNILSIQVYIVVIYSRNRTNGSTFKYRRFN